MHAFTLTAVALLSTLAAAQIPGLPSCAASCVGTSFGDCGSLDVKCICSSTTLLSGLSCCVSTACSEDDQKKTLDFANSLCGGQGVNNLPTAATCESSAAASSTPAPESSGSSAMSSSMSMSMSDSAAMSATSAMSSASSMASSMAEGSSSSSSAASASAGSTTGGSAGSSATTSSSVEQSTGGAESLMVKGGVAGLGLVVAGVVAVL